MMPHTAGFARRVAATLLLGTTVSCSHALSFSTPPPDDRLLQVADEMFAASYFATDPQGKFRSLRRVVLERVTSASLGCEELNAFRAVDQSNSHSLKFVIASEGNAVFRLGGASSPDAAELVSALQRSPRRMELLTLSRCLARLLDPNAGLHVIPLGDSTWTAEGRTIASVRTNWLNGRALSAFSDGVERMADGSAWARVNVLSGAATYGGSAWTWRSYVYHFDAQGLLNHRHVRVDDPVALP